MFNHSSHPVRQNVAWRRDIHRQVVVYVALRDIEPGEELCISYGKLWFKDVEESDARKGQGEKTEKETDATEALAKINI